MTRGTRAALLALLPLGGLLVACGPDEADVNGGASQGPEYVALGDSYTAAPGVGADVDPTGCFRSEQNYPNLLASKRDLYLTDVSCGSAQTIHGEEKQRTRTRSVLPQLDALDRDTKIVTVGLGANDGGLIPRVIFQCPARLAADPDSGSDSPCTDIDGDLGDNSSAAVLRALPDRLVDLYAAIQDRAPNAAVVAVGYPQIFPEANGCELLPIPDGDVPWAAGIVRSLNESISSAAAEAGIPYLDLQTPTRNHHMCAEDPWIAGAEAIPGRAASFHPFAEEQELVAELLDKLLDKLLVR